MKDIGRTQEGNHIVEMNRIEYEEFMKLQNAVEGVDILPIINDPHPHWRFVDEFDFAKTFEVIRAYYSNRFHINHFKQLLDRMKEALEKEDV